MSTAFSGNDIYIFIKEKETVGRFFCRSFFPKEKKDYTIGQPQYTLLFKEKITVSTGEKVIQYDRLTPKSDSAKDISARETRKKGKDRITVTDHSAFPFLASISAYNNNILWFIPAISSYHHNTSSLPRPHNAMSVQ